jgi:hypothetical protein
MFDQNRVPIPVVPRQNIEPWAEALEELLEDPERYRSASDAAWNAATEFVSRADGALFETFLLDLRPLAEDAPSAPPTGLLKKLENLSPERRALLLRKIRRKKAGSGSQ